MNTPKNWIWYRDFMLVLLHKELTVRYKGSLLGFMWSILNPLAQAYIFFLVFGVYMRFKQLCQRGTVHLPGESYPGEESGLPEAGDPSSDEPPEYGAFLSFPAYLCAVHAF